MLDYKKLWKHSLITAIIAKNINKFLKLEDDENLFSASILHDMGKIILDQYDHANYILALTESSDFDLLQNLEAEKKYCGLNHCETGHLIADHWNLPEIISETIRYHHNPQDVAEQYRNIVAVINLANILAIFYEKEIELTSDLLTIIDMETLNLDEEIILNMYSEIVEELEKEDNLDNYFD